LVRHAKPARPSWHGSSGLGAGVLTGGLHDWIIWFLLWLDGRMTVKGTNQLRCFDTMDTEIAFHYTGTVGL